MRMRFSYVAALIAGLTLSGCTVPEPTTGPAPFGLSHRPIYLWLDESGDKPTINVRPESAVTHWTRDPGRVVWVVDGKRSEDEWIIEWKGPDTGSGVDYWPGEKRIPRGTDEAFYTGRPVGDPPKNGDRQELAAGRGDRSGVKGAEWVYSIRVERRMPDGSVRTIAELDPIIVIKHP